MSLLGAISGGDFTGTTAATTSPGTVGSMSSSATGTFAGAFFGPSAQELGAVWTLHDGTSTAIGTIGSFEGTLSCPLWFTAARSRTRPGNARQSQIEQATRAIRAGDWIEAKQRLRMLILQQPNNAEALTMLAQIAVDEQRADEATFLLRRAVSADPSSHRQMVLIKHLHTCAGPAAALVEIEGLSASIRKRVDVRSFEAALLGMLGDHKRQIKICQALTCERPDCAALWINLGDALNATGRCAEAVAAVRRAIDVEPNNGEAYWTLANFKSVGFTGRDIAAMRKALRRKLPDAEKAHFNFALGRAFEDRRDFARSFLHYSAGNDLQRANLRPEQMRVTGFVDVSIATFGRELFDRHRGAGCTTRGPIFVVGLHRSGSTLIEQILASHPLIEGTGELPVMQQIWRKISQTAARFGCSPFEYIERLNSQMLAEIGAEYLESSRSYRRTDRPLFVDKLPPTG